MGLRRKAFAAMLVAVVLFDDAEACSDSDCGPPALECNDNTSNYVTSNSLGSGSFGMDDVYDINIDDEFTGSSKM